MKNTRLKILLTIIIAIFAILGLKTSSVQAVKTHQDWAGWYCGTKDVLWQQWQPYYLSSRTVFSSAPGNDYNTRIKAYIMSHGGTSHCHGSSWSSNDPYQKYLWYGNGSYVGSVYTDAKNHVNNMRISIYTYFVRK